jgi:hypothetical protein
MGLDRQFEIAINLATKGGQVSAQQIDLLVKKAEELDEAGQRAFDALQKVGSGLSGGTWRNLGAANALRDELRATQAAAKAASGNAYKIPDRKAYEEFWQTATPGHGAPIGPQMQPPLTPEAQAAAERQRKLKEIRDKKRREAEDAELSGDDHSNPSVLRRHFGAVAGQALGMPGLGMVMGAGGMVAGIGAAILALERMISTLREMGELGGKIEGLGQTFATIGDHTRNAASYQRELNREMELFKIQVSFIERQVFSTQAIIGQIGQIRDHEAELRARVEDVNLARERENILLNNRLNIMEQIRQVAELDQRQAAIAIEREIAAEERRVQLAKDKQEEAARVKKSTEESLPGLTGNAANKLADANKTKLEQGTAAAISKEVYEEYERKRLALEKIAQGRQSGYAAFGKSTGALALAGEHVSLDDAAIAAQMLSNPLRIPDAVKASARRELERTRARQGQLSGGVLSNEENIAAKDAQAREAAARLDEAKKRVATEEQNIQQGKQEEQNRS